MRIHSVSRIHHPREEVYLTYRDRLSEVAAYLPDIREIVCESRVREEQGEGFLKVHNVWIANRDIPSFARSFLKPEMLRWDDYARWNDDEHLVHWNIGLRVFTDNVTCGGINRFREAEGGGTEVVLEGDLQIELKGIPGVPSFLAKSVAPQVEKFIVGLITPNLTEVNASLESFLDEHGG
jgi:hypothetical protein